MDLKVKAVNAALQRDEDLYVNTRNPRHAWHAWQLARTAKVSVPPWVLRFVDSIAASAIAVRNRNTDTADRYDAALSHMEAAVDRHRPPSTQARHSQEGNGVRRSRGHQPARYAEPQCHCARCCQGSRGQRQSSARSVPLLPLIPLHPEFLDRGCQSSVATFLAVARPAF